MIFLITGGASGLGAAITKRIVADSDAIVYFTFNRSEIKSNDITKTCKNAISIKCDFGNQRDVQDLMEKIAQLDIDVLINNAYSGSFINSHFHKIPSESFLTEFRDNILPTIQITQSFISACRRRKSGRIITILTAALINTPPVGSSVYVANKAYLEQLTKIWAVENAKFNITSTSVSPELMQTHMTKDVDERIIFNIKENHPLKKLLTVEEVAETVFFLCYGSLHLNGVSLVMNSGVNIK